jgi:hypothetical protein
MSLATPSPKRKARLVASVLRDLADQIERGDVRVLEMTEERPAVPVNEDDLGVMVQMVPGPKTTVLVSYEVVTKRAGL